MSSEFDRVINRRAISNLNKWKWYPADVLPMWIADMDFLTPQPILDALRGALAHGILGYELASPSLLEAIAGHLIRSYGWQVSPEMIVPAPGVNVGLRVAALVTCRPGDGVLVQPPVFYHFIDFPGAYGFKRQDAPLRRSDRGRVVDYQFDAGVFEAAIHSGGARTSLFLLCNPHNPIGRVFAPSELKRMAQLCEEHDIALCSDDIHNRLLLGDASYTPLAALSPGAGERTITLLGPGKAFNISGLACAFAVIPQAALRQRFAAELERFDLGVNSLGLVAAREAYSGDCDDWLSALRAYLTDSREYLMQYVAEELPGIRAAKPDATYLAWLDCTELVQTGRIVGPPKDFFLEKGKVALHDGAAFGPGGEGFVRLNFACPRSVLEDGLARMKKALAQ